MDAGKFKDRILADMAGMRGKTNIGLGMWHVYENCGGKAWMLRKAAL
jgi:hypothetical protein